MDYMTQCVAGVMKQFNMLRGANQQPEEKKEQALLELQAMVDPKVWDKMAADARLMLDGATSPIEFERIFDKLKDEARQKQNELESDEGLQAAYKERMTDKLEISVRAS